MNHRDCRGWTSVHAIANILHDRAYQDENNRKRQILDILLKKKANLHLANLRSDYPLALAEARGFALCADALRSALIVKIEDVVKVERPPEPPLFKALREKVLF